MYTFYYDFDDFVIVYTDGACFNNGQPNAVAGYGVYWGPNHPLNRSAPVNGRATNNCGEIQGATQAIYDGAQAGVRRLRIRTDSMLLVRSWNEWFPLWKQNGWRTVSGAPVRNELDFRELVRAAFDNQHMRIEFQHVHEHSGDPWNNAADQLAKQGAQQYRSRYQQSYYTY